MKVKRFNVSPYKDNLFLISPCTKESAEAWLRKRKIPADLSDFDETDGITLYVPMVGNIVFLPNFEFTIENIGILIHELCHATFNTLNSRGVKEENGHEEAAAYLLDHLAVKCLKWLFNEQLKRASAGASGESCTSKSPCPDNGQCTP